MSILSRRGVLGGATFLTAPISLAAPALAQSSAPITWRMATSWPTALPTLHEGAQAFARHASAATEGRLKIEIVDPSVHKKAGGIFDLVRSGEFEAGHTTAHYYKDAVPAFDFFTATPFGFSALENYAWLYAAGGEQLMREVFAPHGIVPFAAGNTGAQMGGWFRREINTVEDIKGIRLRIAGQPGLVWEALGGKAVPLPGGAIPQAFQENTIDAAEFVGPAIDLALGMPKFASYYYSTWHEPSVELHLFANKGKFDALPAELKAALSTAARAAALETLSTSITRNAEAWPRVLANDAIKTRTWPKEVFAAMRRANEDVLSGLLAKDADSRRVVESQRAFQQKSRAYLGVTETVALSAG